MEQSKDDIWFSAKKYGYGWGLPSAWQGWAVYFSYFALLAFGVVANFQGWLPIPYPIYLVAVTAILIPICYIKGEKPRWRWGKES